MPPRLAQQQQHGQKGGNRYIDKEVLVIIPFTVVGMIRYQNQRHPSNRASVKVNNSHTGSAGPVTLGDHMPSQFVSAPGNSNVSKREPLLPTPPSTQVVKLDTNLTCKGNH